MTNQIMNIQERLNFLSGESPSSWCKPGIRRAQLQRLIPRTLWDPNCRQTLPKTLFGLVEHDGIGWNEVVWSYVPLFGFSKNEWKGMKHDGIHSIPYHSLFQFIIPPNLGCMQWFLRIICNELKACCLDLHVDDRIIQW